MRPNKLHELERVIANLDDLHTAWQNDDEDGIEKLLGKLMTAQEKYETKTGSTLLDTTRDICRSYATAGGHSHTAQRINIMKAHMEIAAIIGPDDFDVFLILVQQKQEHRLNRYRNDSSLGNWSAVKEKELKVKIKQLLCSNHDEVMELWKNRHLP